MNNCRDTHNRLLHVGKSRTHTKTETTPDQNRAAQSLPNTQREPKPGKEEAQVVLLPPQGLNDEQARRSHVTVTAESAQSSLPALRTVPVFLRNGDRHSK